jgi:hypothetical protein
MHPYNGRAANVAHVVVGRGVLVLATRGGDLITRDTEQCAEYEYEGPCSSQTQEIKGLTNTRHTCLLEQLGGGP